MIDYTIVQKTALTCIIVAVTPEDLFEFADIWMFELPKNPNLSLESSHVALCLRTTNLGIVDDLDSIPMAGFFMYGFHHGSEGTFAELVAHLVDGVYAFQIFLACKMAIDETLKGYHELENMLVGDNTTYDNLRVGHPARTESQEQVRSRLEERHNRAS